MYDSNVKRDELIETEERLVSTVFEGFTTVSFAVAVLSVLILFVGLFWSVADNVAYDIVELGYVIADHGTLLFAGAVSLVVAAPFIAQIVEKFGLVILASVAVGASVVWAALMLVIVAL